MDIEDCLPTNQVFDTLRKDPDYSLIQVSRKKTPTKDSKQPKIFFKTFGCSHNFSDSEFMAGLLVDEGFIIVSSIEESDLCIINSCTVKAPSETGFLNFIEKCEKQKKKVIIAGCVPSAAPDDKTYAHVSSISVLNLEQIVYVVKETLKGNLVKIVSSRAGKKVKQFSLPKVRKNPFIEIVPIASGCLNNCAYCKTRFARGALSSWPINEICGRIEDVIKEGVKEIRITAEDVGAYGIDIGSSLQELFENILKIDFPSDIRIRIGMTNPTYLIDNLDQFAKTLNHPNVYSFIHIPIQSGSNKVLEEMKREYTLEEFEKICFFLKKHVPNITIATDIICGFPTETDEDFDETLKLVEKHKFEVVNISQMYVRPGTLAAQMKRLDSKIKKKRSRLMHKLFNGYKLFGKYINSIQEGCLIVEYAHDKKNLLARTKNYISVLVDPSEASLGEVVDVKITSSDKFFMRGEVVKKYKKKLNYVRFSSSKKKSKPTKKKFSHKNWKKLFLLLFLIALVFFFLGNLIDVEFSNETNDDQTK